MRLSVLTCTRNPAREPFERMLASLRRQTLPASAWEYLLIDNGSEPALAETVDLSWHPDARVVAEPEPGLTKARLAGIDASAGDVIVFADDDNVLCDDYLEGALRLLDEHPFLGVAGGFVEAEYAVPPEPWMREFCTLFGWADLPERNQPLQYARARALGHWVPIGAGMIVRREVARTYRELVRDDPFRRGLGRSGDSLVGGEDLDLAFTAHDVGLACGITNRIRLTHLIPPSRLELRYLVRLLYACEYCPQRLLLHRGWKRPVDLPPDTLLTRLRGWAGRLQSRGPEALCWRAKAKGQRDGRGGLPFDPAYR